MGVTKRIELSFMGVFTSKNNLVPDSVISLFAWIFFHESQHNWLTLGLIIGTKGNIAGV